MATEFRASKALARMGEDLMATHHAHLVRHKVRVEFLFRDDVPKSAGKRVWGTARKITSLNAFLAGQEDPDIGEAGPPFFVIVISEPIWDDLGRTQQLALLDHELCHCWCEEDKEGNLKLTLLGHDLEEFRAIVDRYGLWRDDVKDFAAAIESAQLNLPLDKAA